MEVNEKHTDIEQFLLHQCFDTTQQNMNPLLVHFITTNTKTIP